MLCYVTSCCTLREIMSSRLYDVKPCHIILSASILFHPMSCHHLISHHLPLSISQKRISSVAINTSGEWLAFGSEKLGQLLVWEWQSETYVLKQQGRRWHVLRHHMLVNMI